MTIIEYYYKIPTETYVPEPDLLSFLDSVENLIDYTLVASEDTAVEIVDANDETEGTTGT